MESEELEIIKKKIREKKIEIANFYEEIRKEKEKPRLKIIEKLKGIKRTSGQHPGGLLISLPEIDIKKYTPLNYPAENRQSEWKTTHFEYSFLSKIFLKLDILGHDEPTVLQKLHELTKINPKNISFHDKKVMELFTKADTLGIPEFGTDFVKKNFLEVLKPNKFSQLVQISGFSHGKDVWTQNQRTVYKSKELSLNELVACREDIWKFLVSWGVENRNAFIATEFIRKGNWDNLSDNIKEEIKKKLGDKKGEIYFSILSKIKYIFPKPHAVAYTMTAWRTAFYKLYYPREFYSVLLTYHATIYDLWLMNFNYETISFRLENLLNNPSNYKNNEKELLSTIRVLEEFEKEKKKTSFQKEIEEISKALITIKKKINSSSNEKLKQNLEKNAKLWKLSVKERELLFTLKVFLEMETKQLGFVRGIDFNNSEINDFKIEGKTIFFPFTSIAGIGEKAAEKIINYKKEKKMISKNWREELKGLINSNHIQQLENLEKYNLILWTTLNHSNTHRLSY